MRELAEAEAAPPPRLLDTSGIGARLREAGHGAGVRRDAGARIARNLGNAKSARMLLDDAPGDA